MLAAWLIGSITMPASALTVDADLFVWPAGAYYLQSPTSSLSMMDFLAARIVANVGGTCTITFTRGRTIRITFDTPRTVTWGAATQLRDLLGFTGDLGSAATHDAPNVSPLLWSAGYLATPTKAPQGVDGYTVPHQSIYKSANGDQVYCAHYGSETWQDLSWSTIMPERLRVDDSTDGGGTFHEFYEQCALLRSRFLYHEAIDELDGSTAAASLDTPRGPYVLREGFAPDWYRRNVPNAEIAGSLDLPMHMVVEYT